MAITSLAQLKLLLQAAKNVPKPKEGETPNREAQIEKIVVEGVKLGLEREDVFRWITRYVQERQEHHDKNKQLQEL